jgi:hypothetical protein
VALVLFQALGFEEGLRHKVFQELLAEFPKDRAVAGKQTCFEQGRLNRQVVQGGAPALIESTHAGGDLQADVVEQSHCPLKGGGQGLVGWIRQQKQDIDIGGWVQFAASVAPDRDQGQRGRQLQGLPQVAEDAVDQLAALVQQARCVAFAEIALTHRSLTRLQSCPTTGNERLTVESGSARGHYLIQSGLGRVPSDTVRTS